MLKGRMAPSRNAGSAVPRSMTAQPGDGQELRIRQTSGIFDKADPSPDRDAKGKLDSRSWDLGVMRLERISLLQGTPRTLHRGNVRAGASAYLQKGTLPDLDFRILIASLDEGASEGFLTAILPCTLLRKSVLSQCRGNMVPLASWRGAILAHHLLSLARELPSVPMEHWSTLGAVDLHPGPGLPRSRARQSRRDRYAKNRGTPRASRVHRQAEHELTGLRPGRAQAARRHVAIQALPHFRRHRRRCAIHPGRASPCSQATPRRRRGHELDQDAGE